jgi:hypothetical protein
METFCAVLYFGVFVGFFLSLNKSINHLISRMERRETGDLQGETGSQ